MLLIKWRNLPMKLKAVLGILAMVVLLIAPSQSQALEKYVIDKLQVTVRTGPSTENKVLAVVSSGDMVELMGREQDGWTLVRAPNGKEGWMLTRYLQEEKPAVLRLKELDPQANKLLEKVGSLESENKELKAELNKVSTEAHGFKAALDKLRAETSDVSKLQTEYESLQKEFKSQAQRLDQVSAEAESLKFGNNLKWFLAGAGVLVLGWILGLVMGRRKKRWSSTY